MYASSLVSTVIPDPEQLFSSCADIVYISSYYYHPSVALDFSLRLSVSVSLPLGFSRLFPYER